MRTPLLLVVITAVLVGGQEILKNPGFETLSDWDCWSIHCELTTDHHGGSHALSVTERKKYYQGPSQTVPTVEGRVYHVQAWVKMINDNSNIQHIELMVNHLLKNGHNNYDTVSAQVPISTRSGWVFLSGEMVVPRGLKRSLLYFQGPEPGLGFLVDDASMTEMHIDNNNWVAEANARIDKIRKSNIHVKVSTDNGMDPSSVTVEITQKKHLFPFGTAVVASSMGKDNSGSEQKYRQFIFDNYNWVVLENSLKWPSMERTRGHVDYATSETAIRRLKSHGIKVRGHNLIWGASQQFTPSWLLPLPQNEIQAEVNKHIKNTVTHFKGLVEHWDVNNELLHGQYYENKFHDPDYTKKIFRLVHQYDPDVKLFLNDYNVVSGGGYTEAYLSQAKDFKASNTYLGGMGVQCHFSSQPIPMLIKQKLDRLAEAGVPLWATELDVMSDDEHQRADQYETAYRMLFSHPAVEGILTWGFWSQHHWRGEAAALVSGPEFRVNAAGKRVLHLMNQEWRTNDSRPLSQSSSYTVRGFHGDYEVKVKVNGHTVQTKQITLGKSDTNLNLHVQGGH
ncbi:anti-sigma-I factor RsgI6-like [Liolophura sinensis]|uniref:anti-sigma-I factor RsgI6-like n=1 Tax=Liolophura sinensis TaxID=3198878 RepID=UPI003158A75A